MNLNVLLIASLFSCTGMKIQVSSIGRNGIPNLHITPCFVFNRQVAVCLWVFTAIKSITPVFVEEISSSLSCSIAIIQFMDAVFLNKGAL